MLRFALLLILLIPYSLARAGTLEFKGVPFGATEQQFLEKHSEFQCSDSQGSLEIVLSDRTCYLFKNGTYAEVAAELSVDFYTNSMAKVGVRFDPASFDFIKRALINKYGKPTADDTETITTAMGGKFLNEKLKWDRRDGMILIRKYNGKITESKLSIYSIAGLAEMEKRKKEAVRQGGSDM